MQELINIKYVISAILFSLIGIGILCISFWIIEKVTPQNLWKEIIEKQNIALALMAAAFIIAIAVIIGSAIHG